MKTLSDQIKAKQAEEIAAKDQLTLVIKSLEEIDQTDPEAVKAAEDKVAELTATIEAAQKSLNTLRGAEAAFAGKAASPAIIHNRGEVKDPFNLIVRSALATFESHVTKAPIAQVLEQRYGKDREYDQTKAVNDFLVNKATQNPALTNVAGWAQELTQQAYASFMDLLTPTSVYAAMPLERYTFDNFNSIYIPMRLSRAKNIAGAFRAEGAPIPVKGTQLTSMVLTPKSMAVISTFTQEMLRRSTPNIEQLIRKWMLEDTSIALDSVFLGTGAGSATQPAGIANALGANSVPSTGNTSADITADVRGMLQRMAAAQLGGRPVWIMDPQRKIGLELSLTPTGTLAFPSVSANNTFLGYPIITSLNVVDSEVFLVDASQVGGAGGAPSFMGSDQATVHEEDTAPAEVGGDTTPVRSFYQTNTLGLRMMIELDWKVFRSGAVQQLTGVSW
jgi:hypothetical protein